MKLIQGIGQMMLLSAAFTFISNAQEPALWLRDVKISPDGKNIAFTYKGDIWTVPSGGGTAKRITTTSFYEDHPIWSPDSKLLAFSSDRNGNFDIFLVPAGGGEATQLTFNSANEIPEAFTPDGKDILFSAAIQDNSESALFPSARMTELYSVPVTGGNPVQVAGVPILYPFFSPDNSEVIYYQDHKGMEDEWRKHHTSSVTRDIWKYDRKSGKFENVTNRPGEDRNPVVTPDGKTLIYIKEEPGKTLNLFSQPVDGSGEGRYLTSFTEHPVRFLSIADNGLMCYTYDGEIYTQKGGGEPQKIEVVAVTDQFNPVEKMALRSIEEGVPSPDGSSVAFISRGEVFVTSADYATTKQITHTPEAERQLSWSPDGKKLIYTSERDGHWNIYTAQPAREDENNFANSTLIEETPLFDPTDKTERTYASYSPDGNRLAYIQDRNKLMVKNLKTGEVKQLLDGKTHISRSGGYGYEWSPDGKWIVTEGVLHNHDPYTDIFIVNTETAEMIPLTETGYFDESPIFALDGEAVVFQSDRYGMRNHASWGSQQDVMIAFLTQDAYDRFRLNEEDYKLLKEVEKANKKDSPAKKEASDKQGKGDKKDGEDKKSVKTIEVDRGNIQDRLIRLTPASSDVSDKYVTPDGEALYYISSANGDGGLWKINLRDKKSELVRNLESPMARFSTSQDGKNVLLLSRNSIRKMDDKGKLTPVSYEGKQEVDHAKERAYMFDYVKRQEREMFYNKNMHGVDWENLTEHYRRFLPHITDNYEFAEMLSELLGELNVSHTGGRYSPQADGNAVRTASLGLLFDMNSENPEGLVVTEVLEGGPMAKSWSKIKPGAIVMEINGNSLSGGNRTTPFNDIAGKKTLVKYKQPDGSMDEEVVVPVSKGAEQELLYNRWVKNRAADVDKWSGGRLGYVHIRSMGDDSFRDIYADVLGKYNEKDGIVIDIRWNGGGRLHEDVEVLFSGNKYFTQVVRDQIGSEMPSKRWNKPSIMVQAEACYSNAHGTPWVYKHTGIGKLVGAPVPGTMTSVNWVRMQDPTMVFGIPVTGYQLPDGSYLENTQLEPDIYVLNPPEAIVAGEDIQLKRAVEELLKEIAN